jgi:hypothetical protein
MGVSGLEERFDEKKGISEVGVDEGKFGEFCDYVSEVMVEDFLPQSIHFVAPVGD